MRLKSAHNIIISPVGDFTTDLLDPIRDEIKRIYGYPTEVLPLLDDLEFAYHPNRNQYHSTSILDQLALKAPVDAIKVMAITQVDLFIPILTHVYGEAQLGGKACIVSTIRLNEGHGALSTQEPYFSRIVKEAIHELGHTYNLIHCHEHPCVMMSSTYVDGIDQKSARFCPACQSQVKDQR